MSRSQRLATLFLVLGTVDLVLLNGWLVPAAWPPSDVPAMMPAAPAVVDGTRDVPKAPATPASAAPAPQTEPEVPVPMVAAVMPEAARTGVSPETANDRSPEPRVERAKRAAQADEPQPVGVSISGPSEDPMEPEEQVAGASGPVVDRDAAGAADSLEPQPLAPPVPSAAEAGAAETSGAGDAGSREQLAALAAASPPSRSLVPEKAARSSTEVRYQTIHQAMVRFDFDGDNLGSDARRVLAETARYFSEHQAAEMQVDGHSDSRGKQSYNYRLSERRAGAVAAVLEAEGVPPERMQIRGHGPSRPLDERNNAAARAKNRRVEITIRSRLP